METLLYGSTLPTWWGSMTGFKIALYTTSEPGLDYNPTAFTFGSTTVGVDTDTVGAEVSTSATGYSRVDYGRTTADWTVAGNRSVDGNSLEYNNTNAITFGAPTANWGTINYLAMFGYDGADQYLLFTAQLSSGKTVNSGDGAPKILANQLKISRAYC
jgi:hypothetical protein